MTEHDIYLQIAQYLRLRYPSVIYRYDLAADLKLSIGQAKKHKALQHYRGYPDLFIAEPYCRVHEDMAVSEDKTRVAITGYPEEYNGLFLEIKKPGTRIFTKKGLLVADEHIREQFDMLESLRRRGYRAEFAIGYDEAVKIIDEYLGGPEKVEF